MSNNPVAHSAATGRDIESRAAPGAALEVRYVDAAGGVVITVCGVIGRNDAAVLSKHLHTALDTTPTVVVVNLRRVPGYDPTASEVLAQARERARAEGVAFHVINPDAPPEPADRDVMSMTSPPMTTRTGTS